MSVKGSVAVAEEGREFGRIFGYELPQHDLLQYVQFTSSSGTRGRERRAVWKGQYGDNFVDPCVPPFVPCVPCVPSCVRLRDP